MGLMNEINSLLGKQRPRKRRKTKKQCGKMASRSIRRQLNEGRPQNQAIAIGLSKTRRRGCARFIRKNKKRRG